MTISPIMSQQLHCVFINLLNFKIICRGTLTIINKNNHYEKATYQNSKLQRRIGVMIVNDCYLATCIRMFDIFNVYKLRFVNIIYTTFLLLKVSAVKTGV